MANEFFGRQDPGNQGAPNEGVNMYGKMWGYEYLPYEDPAKVNPQELATFPKLVRKDIAHHHPHHHHHYDQSKHITRTDNHPDKDGYI
ncbi:hypothetical protein [Flavobacterium sp.]|uniref:hypothetical protein n=1 Tax=Flavobacterium sp. TaxID=239 RepID=UPI003A918152